MYYGTIKIWNLNNKSCVKTITVSGTFINSTSIVDLFDLKGCIYSIVKLGENKICIGGYDKLLKIWDIGKD